ncbi:MAG: hypothetical protein ACR2OZ_14500 [Verrucomicrobiales bacterium]
MPARSRNIPGPKTLHTLHLQTCSPIESLTAEERQLRSRIEDIERLLREAPEVEYRRRRIRRVTLPPPDKGWSGRPQTAAGNDRRLTKLERRALARAQWRHAMLSGGLVMLLVGLVSCLARILQS